LVGDEILKISRKEVNFNRDLFYIFENGYYSDGMKIDSAALCLNSDNDITRFLAARNTHGILCDVAIYIDARPQI
jgi:membrane protease subunit (stomatin/prohibitin family)